MCSSYGLCVRRSVFGACPKIPIRRVPLIPTPTSKNLLTMTSAKNSSASRAKAATVETIGLSRYFRNFSESLGEGKWREEKENGGTKRKNGGLWREDAKDKTEHAPARTVHGGGVGMGMETAMERGARWDIDKGYRPTTIINNRHHGSEVVGNIHSVIHTRCRCFLRIRYIRSRTVTVTPSWFLS